MTQALRFTLDSLREPVMHRQLSVDAADLELPAGEVRYRGPVQISLDLARLGDRVHVRGAARVPIAVTCVRCLEPIETELRAEIELVAVPRPDSFCGEEDAEGFVYHDGESLDLAGEVREAIVLEMPRNPVCREDCRGLCPHCGENLNLGACQCGTGAAADPRWAALKTLQPKPDSRPRGKRGGAANRSETKGH